MRLPAIFQLLHQRFARIYSGNITPQIARYRQRSHKRCGNYASRRRRDREQNERNEHCQHDQNLLFNRVTQSLLANCGSFVENRRTSKSVP
ncbi:MAG: hypothetical protein WBH10_11185 [Allopontixanthobacter sediminis]